MDENYVPPTKRRRCCVAGCTNRDNKRHRFPKNQPDVFNTWIERIKPYNYKNLSRDKIYNSYLVCHEHFSPECMVPGTKRGLKFGAVPSLRIPGFQEKPDHQELSASVPVGIDPAMCLQKSAEFEALPSTSYSEPRPEAICLQTSVKLEALPSTSYSEPRPEDTLCSSPIGVNNSQPVMKLIPCLPAPCLTDYSDCFPQLNEKGNESTGQKPVYQSNYSEPTEFEEESDRIERASSPSRSGSVIRKRGPVPEHIEDFEESDLEIKSKRHQYWNLSQQTFQKYRKRINYLRTKLKKQNDKIRAMNSILNDLRKK